jgi:hypothetical protein
MDQIIEYFATIAIIPYKNSDPDFAEQWVRDNAKMHGSKVNIGGVWYSIDREISWILHISAVEPKIETLSEQRTKEIQEEDLFFENEKEEDEFGQNKVLIEINELDSNVSKTDIPEQDENYLYFSFKVRMTNNTSNEIVLEPKWILFTTDMHIYVTDEETCYLKKPVLDGKLLQGESKEGWITFKTDSNFLFLESTPRRFDGELRPLFLDDL